MAVIQLTGGAVAAPQGALSIRLSLSQGVELVLLDAHGSPVAPNFQVTRGEVVIVASGAVTVTARPTTGAPFTPGTRLGVSIRSASGHGDEIVRAPAEVGGRHVVSLVDIRDGQVIDLVGQATAVEKAWMQRGNYAFHVHHPNNGGRSAPWALVLDGSATAHRTAHAESYQTFLELVLGVAASGFGTEPQAWHVATRPVRDVTRCLEGEQIDWSVALGHRPAPWPCFGDAVDTVLRTLPADGALVLITDGVFVDYREVRQRVEGRECIVVALGRSRFGARPADRPEHFWEEELESLALFDRVVSVAGLSGLGDDATLLADAMFPGGAQ